MGWWTFQLTRRRARNPPPRLPGGGQGGQGGGWCWSSCPLLNTTAGICCAHMHARMKTGSAAASQGCLEVAVDSIHPRHPATSASQSKAPIGAVVGTGAFANCPRAGVAETESTAADYTREWIVGARTL